MLLIWLYGVFVISQVTKLCTNRICPSYKWLCLDCVTKLDLFMNFFLILVKIILRLNIEFSSCLTLTVFLTPYIWRKQLILMMITLMNVISAVQSFSFIKCNLFINIIFACLSFLFFHKKIVCWCNLIVFIILNIGLRLLQIFTSKMSF